MDQWFMYGVFACVLAEDESYAEGGRLADLMEDESIKHSVVSHRRFAMGESMAFGAITGYELEELDGDYCSEFSTGTASGGEAPAQYG